MPEKAGGPEWMICPSCTRKRSEKWKPGDALDFLWASGLRGAASGLPRAPLGSEHRSTSPASHFNVPALVPVIYLKIVPKTKMVGGQLSLLRFTTWESEKGWTMNARWGVGLQWAFFSVPPARRVVAASTPSPPLPSCGLIWPASPDSTVSATDGDLLNLSWENPPVDTLKNADSWCCLGCSKLNLPGVGPGSPYILRWFWCMAWFED